MFKVAFKNVSTKNSDMQIQINMTQDFAGMEGFNECLQGVDVNELFEEFTEASVVKQSVNQQQIFNNCSVTIVYKKD